MNWMTSPPNVATIAVMGIAVLLVGCRAEPEAEVYDPENYQGSIDPDLPLAMQDKQNAIIRLFTAIQDVGVDHISEEDPNIRFEETSAQFFEDDTIHLARWDWDGPPKDDEFHVVLVLCKDEPGLPEVEKHRTYVVRRSGKRFTIGRGN
jgi:hypothetical protein